MDSGSPVNQTNNTVTREKFAQNPRLHEQFSRMSRRQREVTSASPATLERRRVFLRFAPIVCFVELSTGYKLCCASHQLQVFQRMAPVACFTALGTGYKLCCASQQLQVFLRLARVASFPAHGTGCKFSRASHQLQVSRAWHRLQVFPRLAPVANFPALATG